MNTTMDDNGWDQQRSVITIIQAWVLSMTLLQCDMATFNVIDKIYQLVQNDLPKRQ